MSIRQLVAAALTVLATTAAHAATVGLNPGSVLSVRDFPTGGFDIENFSYPNGGLTGLPFSDGHVASAGPGHAALAAYDFSTSSSSTELAISGLMVPNTALAAQTQIVGSIRFSLDEPMNYELGGLLVAGGGPFRISIAGLLRDVEDPNSPVNQFAQFSSEASLNGDPVALALGTGAFGGSTTGVLEAGSDYQFVYVATLIHLGGPSASASLGATAFDLTLTAVPIPAALPLFLCALIGVGVIARRGSMGSPRPAG